MSLDDDNIMPIMLKYLETAKNKNILEKLNEAISETIKEIDNKDFEADFEKQFPDLHLEYCSSEFSDDKRSIEIEFYLEEDGRPLNLKCQYFSNREYESSRNFVFTMEMAQFGYLRSDANNSNFGIYFKPDYKELIPDYKQELFDEVVLYIASSCWPYCLDDLFHGNPFACSDEHLRYVTNAYKLANEMGLEIKYLNKENFCLKMHDGYWSRFDIDDIKKGLYAKEIALFCEKLIEML